ncbi:hypothetical protein D3C72_2310940 [compost metagenome]
MPLITTMTTPRIKSRYLESMNSPRITLPLNSGGMVEDSGAEPQNMRRACSATMARPKVTSRLRMGSAA